MPEKLTCWNQYGLVPDVFDKYREPLRRISRGMIRLLAMKTDDFRIGTLITVADKPLMTFGEGNAVRSKVAGRG